MLKAQIEEQPERNGQINILKKTSIKGPTIDLGKKQLLSILTRRIKRTQIRKDQQLLHFMLCKASYCRLWLASAIIVGCKSTCIRSYIFWQYKRFFDIFWSFFGDRSKQEGFFSKISWCS
jgi:hypothetical protein